MELAAPAPRTAHARRAARWVRPGRPGSQRAGSAQARRAPACLPACLPPRRWRGGRRCHVWWAPPRRAWPRGAACRPRPGALAGTCRRLGPAARPGREPRAAPSAGSGGGVGGAVGEPAPNTRFGPAAALLRIEQATSFPPAKSVAVPAGGAGRRATCGTGASG